MLTRIYRNENGYHLELNGSWHRNLSLDEAYITLVQGGAEDRDARMQLYTAPRLPKLIELEFIGGRRGNGYRRWIVDGQAVSKVEAYRALRRTGLKPEEVKRVLKVRQQQPRCLFEKGDPKV